MWWMKCLLRQTISTSTLTCSPVRWPQSWSLGGQRHTSGDFCPHQERCHPPCQQHVHSEWGCLKREKKTLHQKKPWKMLDTVSQIVNKTQNYEQFSRIIPGITLMAGWLFLWTLLPSCCSRLWCGGSARTRQKVSSSGGSTQANVLRSAWVLSALSSWLLQRATWAASSISPVVSSALRKEWMDCKYCGANQDQIRT